MSRTDSHLYGASVIFLNKNIKKYVDKNGRIWYIFNSRGEYKYEF